MGTRLGFLLLCLLSARPCPAQVVPETTVHNVLLRVVDASTGAPLPGVPAEDRTSGLQASTNREGQLSLKAAGIGTVILRFTRDGYQDAVHVISVRRAKDLLVELAPLVSEPSTGWSSASFASGA